MLAARRLDNKVIIVTGASSGIGKSTALLLSQHGAKLGLLDVNTPTEVAAEITATGGQATGIQCDVRSPGQVEQAVKSVVEMYGPLHGAANLAGIMTKHTMGLSDAATTQSGSFRDLDDEEWDRMLAVNLNGVKNCVRAELRHVSPDGCSIVNAASVAGQLPSPYNSAYGVSKAGVISLTISVAHEVGRHGIRVNAIAPGLIETPLVEHLTEQQKVRVAEKNTMGRAGRPDEVATMILYLLSDESSFCNGSVYNVDAGRK